MAPSAHYVLRVWGKLLSQGVNQEREIVRNRKQIKKTGSCLFTQGLLVAQENQGLAFISSFLGDQIISQDWLCGEKQNDR